MLKARKVLLVHVPGFDAWLHRPVFLPLKFTLLSIFSHLRNAGVPVEVLDLEVELGRPAGPEDLDGYLASAERLVARREFDIAAVGCYTSYIYGACLAIGRICRKVNPEAFLVAGGYHPASVPADFECGPFDAVLTGESEIPLLELATVPSLRRGDRLQVIPGKPVPMDSPAGLRWEEYPYLAKVHVPLVLSRGCPFHCDYCVEPWAGSGWRPYPVRESLRLIETVSALYGPRCISIHDPIFGFERSWRREFLRGLLAMGCKASFNVETRVDLLEPEDLELIGRLNLSVHLGVETGSERMLGIMRKTAQPRRYLERLRAVLAGAARNQATLYLNMIFNHPGETPATLQETLDFFSEAAEDLRGLSYRFTNQSFAFMPGSPQFFAIADYEERYGTQVFWKEWWKSEPETGHQRAIDVVASRETSAAFGRDHAYWRPLVAPVVARTWDKACSRTRFEIAAVAAAAAQAETLLPRRGSRQPA